MFRALCALTLSLMVAPLPFVHAETTPSTTALTQQVPISEIEGEIVKMVPDKLEIYVLSGTKKHEYYFNPDTVVLKGDTTGSYADLKTGMKVRVTANRFGKRLDPTKVTILE